MHFFLLACLWFCGAGIIFGDEWPRIKRINEGSLAELQPQLEVGMTLLAINGQSVDGCVFPTRSMLRSLTLGRQLIRPIGAEGLTRRLPVGACRLFLGPGFRLGARWNRLGEAVKTRKKREKTGGKWAR